jgi:hypothetical protein
MMSSLWIIVTVSLAVLFITLGTSANAAFKTPNLSLVAAIKFAFFMAVSYFCFYCIGAWMTGFLLTVMPSKMWSIAASILFFAVAVKIAWNVFSRKSENYVCDLSKTVVQFMFSIIGGFNALLISAGLTFFQVSTGFPFTRNLILKTALIVILGAFAGSMIGAGLSAEMAKKVNKLRPAIVGGGVMLAIAGYLLV